MIRLSDTVILAGTKLRTHPIRTIITVGLSSILFAGLIAAFIMAQGISQSLDAFNQQGLNNRYIVAASGESPLAGDVLASPQILARAIQKRVELIADKTAMAKKLGISYDSTTEPAATFTQSAPGRGTSTHLNLRSDAAQAAVAEYVGQHPSPGISQLKEAAAGYHPIGIYTANVSTVSSGNILTMPSGEENFYPTEKAQGSVDFLQTARLEEAQPELTSPFMLQHLTTDKNAIPIVVSYASATRLLGLAPLPSSASASLQSSRIEALYSKAGSTRIDACYRNFISQDQITQAETAAKDSADKNYIKKTVTYGLPASDSCGQAVILSDTRTTTEKATQVSQDTFNAAFGQTVHPVQQKMTFQIAGLSPDPSGSTGTTFGGLVAGIVGSTLDGGATVIPSHSLDALPNADTIKSILFSQPTNAFGVTVPTYFVEFSRASDARNFITDKSCTTRVDGTCATADRLFNITPQNNHSIALQDLQQKITTALFIATAIVAILAVVIMTSMVGRTVSDGRRETAVFRALGARRADIAAIYTLYTGYLIICIVIISLTLGVTTSYVINKLNATGITLQARLLFDAVHTHITFSLFSINYAVIGIVVVIIIITGLLSMIVPLLRNIPRSPIKDMREE